MLVTILSLVMVAYSPANIAPGITPMPLGGGGPDSFGYRYLDSDTTAPGAPTYNWINIKGVGTEITSLGDDNYAGPIPIGFDFPYYWYKVSNVFVGSNGYITFTKGGLNASPFNPIPGTQLTNNTVAPLCADLTCDSMSPNGSVWYWSNAAADTFIVEWDSITFWSTGGNNTFQVILSRHDSSITFQYKEQSGAPYNGWAPTSNQTGIENVSGAIGVNYLSGTVPPGNMYHDSLAVRFFPPESTHLVVHDVGLRSAMNDRSGGVFAVQGRPIRPWGYVSNFGNQPESSFKVYFKVTRLVGTVVFFDSLTVGPLVPGAVESLAANGDWRPANTGEHYIRVFTKMTGDMLGANDTATVECQALTLPGWLVYDAGSTPPSSMYWNGPGGFGNRFVPPVYPCSISSVRAFFSMVATPSTPTIAIYKDDGPSGGPGTVMWDTTVSVADTNWHTVSPPSPVVITDGAFFVGATSTTSGDPSFGMDSVPPISYQAWEYTGVWAPSRDLALRDVCINAMVSGPVGISEWMQPGTLPAPVKLNISPNPFGTQATIRLLNPRGTETAVELYDATGSVVRTLGLKRGSATLDGRLLADGIYFARLVGATSPVAKVIVAH